METEKNKKPELGEGVYHPGARPMEVFVDDDECWWLCDKDVNPYKPFEQQGCWRCKDLAFTRND